VKNGFTLFAYPEIEKWKVSFLENRSFFVSGLFLYPFVPIFTGYASDFSKTGKNKSSNF